jgi:hypothetical protein
MKELNLNDSVLSGEENKNKKPKNKNNRCNNCKDKFYDWSLAGKFVWITDFSNAVITRRSIT